MLFDAVKFTLAGPGAIRSLLRGAVCMLLSFTVFFAFAAAGYLMRVLCATIEGRTAVHPPWDTHGRLFNEGVLPVLVTLVYFLPVLLAVVFEQPILAAVGPTAFCAACLLAARTVLLLLSLLLLGPALTRLAVTNRLSAAFELSLLLRHIRRNGGRVAAAFGLSIASWIAAAVTGVLLLGVGIFFTSFAAAFLAMALQGLVYRRGVPFDDDAEAMVRASMVVPPPLRG